MRVVEPQRFVHDRPPKHRKKFLQAFIAVVFVMMGGWFGLQALAPSSQKSENINTDTQAVTEIPVRDPEEAPIMTVEPETGSVPQLRIFADNDFKIFFDQLLQPNLLPVENPPEISGDTLADARIRTIAENRGYRLRSSPSSALSSVDGYSVQAPVVQAWTDLKAAAAAEGLNMSIVSAYRSVERQRTLFLSRLAATGASIQQVADGVADDKVNSVLVTSSIPGYSKHHTGYTIDILCAGWAFENFKNSPCNSWITAENYRVAKEHGFIPSYPEHADLQGPDPEAWEYVWVGTDVLYE